MTPQYRRDYAGEFVILNSTWSGGRKQQQREWIANPIENHHISGRAACIGSAFDRPQFDYTRLQTHRGGLLGSKKLQTYGLSFASADMRLDFVVESQTDALQTLKESGYSASNTVYTGTRNCLNNPGEFYLIPNNPKLLDIVTILYLAAFDGHSEIFMLGYNKETPVDNPGWIQQVASVIRAYGDTQFVMVGEPTNMPEEWFATSNAQAMNYRQWISYCDV
jgi:hypothetical protein